MRAALGRLWVFPSFHDQQSNLSDQRFNSFTNRKSIARHQPLPSAGRILFQQCSEHCSNECKSVRAWLPIFIITLNVTHNLTPKHTARLLSNWSPRYATKTHTENRKQGEQPKKPLSLESFFGTELRRL